MAVKICLIAPISSASGDANAKDQHGHQAGTVGFRKRQRTGNQFIKLGKNAPRDLESKPLSVLLWVVFALFAGKSRIIAQKFAHMIFFK